MEKFTTLNAIAAPLMRVNIDTDIIIPSREMKRVSKKGLANGLFAGWRYLSGDTRKPDPDFVLNQPQYLGTQILICGDNFGCGSSREHAVWALVEYGIRAIIAPSFSAIFFSNCIQNGVLPLELSSDQVVQCAKLAVGGNRGIFNIDLMQQTLTRPDGVKVAIMLAENDRQNLLEGLDPIDRTLRIAAAIDDFEQKDVEARPWAHL